ncbi:MAG TPA: LysR family transcriptional regulator [Bordetella sp.]|jgi:DNA-binding transcriptional LysR family regulator|nr:LysR family transcriptional regulator [Bordetella sp.]
MEIYQLRTLLVVAREQHLTRAAERLHISQPAVSGQIKSLEQELGVILFERRHGGMELTKAGAALLVRVEKILAAAAELTAEARRLSGKIIGRMSLGVILNPSFIRLGELTTWLMQSHPMLDVDIRHRNSASALNSIRSHELDASFYLGSEVPPDVRSIVLRPVRYRMVAAPAWSAKVDHADWKAIADMPWITTPREGGFFKMVDGLLRGHGERLKTVVEADQESAIVNLAQAGVGLSLLREELADEAVAAGRLVAWDRGNTTSCLRLIYLADRENDAIIREILAGVRAIWGADSDTRASGTPASTRVDEETALPD